MKQADYMALAETMIKQIKKGAFLTVKGDGKVNTMTIGWAGLGFSWMKPVFMVAVRDSRFTYTILEKADDFTVSVPTSDMKEAILFCGTKSGRDIDKFEHCGLTPKDAQKTSSPIIDIPGIHLECKIIVKTPMDPDNMHRELYAMYPEKDYHVLYFGEILACYER